MDAVIGFLRVGVDPRSYLSLLYALARLPLSLGYGLFLSVGLGLSLLLLPIGVGIVVFILLLAGTWVAASFERELLTWWFGTRLRPMPSPDVPGKSLWRVVRDLLASPLTWKSFIYLLVQVPAGFAVSGLFAAIVALVLVLVLLPVGYLADGGSAPQYATNVSVAGTWTFPLGRGGPLVDLAALTGLGLAGLGVGLLGLHAARLNERLHGGLARALLGVGRADYEAAVARAQAAAERARAERSDQTRRELVVNMSHELRTPIASIRGHVETLLDPPVDPSPEQAAHYLEVVRREAERLGLLVDDLMAAARSEAGELRLEVRPVHVADVAAQVHSALAPIAARDRQVALLAQVPPELPTALADPERLAQVLGNLVRNAIVYTPEGGLVSIQGGADADGVYLSVADTGIGIAPEDLSRVFDRFYRTDQSRSRPGGGFGLGLAICRDLVEAMGGQIWVESQLSTGSRFTVRLRRA